MSDPYNLKKIGKFYHCDFVVRGIRVHRSTKRGMKADAETEAKRWYDEALDKANGVKTVPTLAELHKEWARIKKDQFSEKHIDFMTLSVQVHASNWVDLPANEINNEVIEEVRAQYLATTGIAGFGVTRKHTKGGANQVVKQLHALLGWAVDQGKIPNFPFKVKKLTPQPKARPVLWPEQVKAFLEEADRGGGGGGKSLSAKEDHKPPQSATALRLMVGLGLREGEALQADWGWVDWRREVFQVGGMAIGRDTSVKDATIREIPMPSWLVAHVVAVWTEAGKPATGLILHTSEGIQREKRFTAKPVERCGRMLGVPGLFPHCLRATFATGHFEVGTALSQIQQMMGHESPETTLKYITQRPKDQAAAQARLAQIMGFADSSITQKSPEEKT